MATKTKSEKTVACPHCKGTGRVVKPTKVPWKCPACGAPAGEHGSGECLRGFGGDSKFCDGFICECDDDGTAGHGETSDDPCHSANCQHCGWGGVMPKDAFKKQRRPRL
jgi:hypothetical protein